MARSDFRRPMLIQQLVYIRLPDGGSESADQVLLPAVGGRQYTHLMMDKTALSRLFLWEKPKMIPHTVIDIWMNSCNSQVFLKNSNLLVALPIR